MMVIAKRTIGGAITQNCVQNGIVIPPIRSPCDYNEKRDRKQQKSLAFDFFPSIFVKIYG